MPAFAISKLIHNDFGLRYLEGTPMGYPSRSQGEIKKEGWA